MVQTITLKYINKHLKIGLADWRVVYSVSNNPTRLYPEVHRGKLVYRAQGSDKRISYDQIKRGLLKQEFNVYEVVPDFLPL